MRQALKSLMTGASWVALATVCLASFSQVRAATRNVPFAGMAGARPNYDETLNQANTADCRILVSNVSAVPQIIDSVLFNAFNSATNKPQQIGPQDSAKYDSGTPNPPAAVPVCTGTVAARTLQPGGFCMFRVMVDTVPYDGSWGVCSGRISVTDSDTLTPGSVVASGALYMIQEAVVLGGTLTGAYYASGTHLQTAGNLAAHPSFPAPLGWSHNMNYYCTTACQAAGGPSDFCNSNCGQKDATNGSTDGLGLASYLISGTIERAPSGIATRLGAPTALPNYDDGAGPHQLITPSNAVPPALITRTANGHFAGGMVYEIEMGPLVSICSGNPAYYARGGQDFTHADGVDGHAAILGNPAGSYPPERLICNHRHASDDLYLGSGSTTPIVINGGTSF